MRENHTVFGRGLVCVALSGAIGLFSLSPARVAAQVAPSPPVLCVDSGCTPPYSLGPVPFGFSWPVPPSITREQVVTPTTLGTYIGTPGLRLVLSAGTYGDRTFSSQDQEIVFRAGAVVGNVYIGESARRLKFRGETPRAGRFNIIAMPYNNTPEDIMFDGVYGETSPGASPSNVVQGHRVAIINSYLKATSYGLSSMPNSGGATDVVIANNNIISSTDQSGVRLMNVDRLVFVDNRVGKESSGLLFRLHSDATTAPINNAYIARNQIEGMGQNYGNVLAPGSNPNNAPAPMRGVIFESNDTYCNCGVVFGDGASLTTALSTSAQSMTVRNNRSFGGPLTTWTYPLLTGWIWQNNTVLPMQQPPPWNFR
jgi:hypothetical protein